jgi:hypothetical protein
VLITPVSLYLARETYDFQVQFTLWTASGRYAPGATDNRGAGFASLVYSIGGVYYPGANRQAWSLSGVARIGRTSSSVIPASNPATTSSSTGGSRGCCAKASTRSTQACPVLARGS